MRSRKIILTLCDGGAATDYVLDQPQTCTVGRAYDCNIQLLNNPWHQDASRYHCQFEVDPPGIRVRDLGSTNGTFVNGSLIGSGPLPRSVAMTLPARELEDGDESRVGLAIIHVQVLAGAANQDFDDSSVVDHQLVNEAIGAS